MSGWTAMSLAPNPELFARAHNTINSVTAPGALPTAPAISPTPLATSAPALSGSYQNLQRNIFPTLAQQQLSAATQPAQAAAEVAKQVAKAPWNPAPAEQPKNFLSPTTGQSIPTQQKVPAAKTSGWVSNLPQI